MKNMAWLMNQIKFVREELGMTQVQLEKKTGLDQSVISQIENNPDGNYSLSTLERLAEGLNCELNISLKPKEDIPEVLRRKSREAAIRSIRVSSGTTAIEMQLPDQAFVEQQIEAVQDMILKKYKSKLWDEI